MDLFMLGEIRWWAQALAVLFVLVCVILIVIILLQKGRGGGLSAAFGGAGGHSAFGSKTGDVFTWATIVVVAVFLLLSMVLTSTYKPYEPEDEAAKMMRQQSGQAATVPAGDDTSGTSAPAGTPDAQPAANPAEAAGDAAPDAGAAPDVDTGAGPAADPAADTAGDGES